jgi:hypothetical protein
MEDLEDSEAFLDNLRRGWQLHTEKYWRSTIDKRYKQVENGVRAGIDSVIESCITKGNHSMALISAEIRDKTDKEQADRLCRDVLSVKSLEERLWRVGLDHLRDKSGIDIPSAALVHVPVPDSDATLPDTDAPAADRDVPGPVANAPAAAPVADVHAPAADAQATDANVPGPAADIDAVVANPPASDVHGRQPDANIPGPGADAPAPDASVPAPAPDAPGPGVDAIPVASQVNDADGDDNGKSDRRMGMGSPTRASHRKPGVDVKTKLTGWTSQTTRPKRNLEKGPDESQSASKRARPSPQHPEGGDPPDHAPARAAEPPVPASMVHPEPARTIIEVL